MEAKEILLKHPRFREGYSPVEISTSQLTFDELNRDWRILHRIPGKITAYFDRNKIKAVFKGDYARDPRDNPYMLLAVDNTVFMVRY